MTTIPPNCPIGKRVTFTNVWHDLERDELINKVMPPEFGGAGGRRAQPPLVAMIACEVWRIIINKIKDWFTPAAIEPDEEN